MKKIFEGFSVKKLLLCILCTIIVTTSIGFTILFVPMAFTYTSAEILGEVDENSEELRKIGYGMQENYNLIKEKAEEQKAAYGDDYPAEGIFLYEVGNLLRTNAIVRVYTLSLLIGIILGTLIYIIFIQKTKGSQMLLESVICGMVILLLVTLINIGYKEIVNAGINNIGAKTQNSTYITYIYDTETHNVIYVFIGIIIAAYIINLIYQKKITTKLNKKLNKK